MYSYLRYFHLMYFLKRLPPQCIFVQSVFCKMYMYPTCSSSNLTIESSDMQITVGSVGTPQARCDTISCLRLSGILIVEVAEAVLKVFLYKAAILEKETLEDSTDAAVDFLEIADEKYKDDVVEDWSSFHS